MAMTAPPLTLAIEAGPPRAHVGPLEAGEYRIGRAPENEIQLVDIAVSRQHARLAVVDGRWCLRDLDSTQGTQLNAARLVPEQDVALAAEDRIRIGPWTFVVRLARAPDEPVPASLQRPSTIGSVPQLRLRALFALVQSAEQAEDEQALLDALCRDLGASLAYDRVAVLRGDVDAIEVAAIQAREGSAGRAFSTTLLRAAEPDEPAVLESIAPGELGASLVAMPVAHALCFRLGGVRRPTWLYLDRAEPFRDRDGSVLAYVEAAARIAALALAHREGLAAAAERERLVAERAQARRIQQQLCASRAGRNGALDYAFSTEPGDGMCGDFIDVVAAPDGAAWCFVGDVVGHGTAAALLMATALAVLRSECRRSASPAQVADHLAAELAPVLAPGQFLTLWLARVAADGRAEVVDAGHGQCWIARAAGAVDAIELRGHPPIGVVPDARHGAEPLSIAPGDRCIVATDGYSESLADPAVRIACRDLLARPASATDTLAALRRLARRNDDDASLLVLERRA
jgi:hypothetical protein